MTRRLTVRLRHAKRKEQFIVSLAKDIKTLSQWLSHDVLGLAEPPLNIREELLDFIVTELQQRKCKAHPKVRALKKVLHNLLNLLLRKS